MDTYNTKGEMSRVKEEGWNMMKQLLDTYNTNEEAWCVFEEYRQKVLKELKEKKREE